MSAQKVAKFFKKEIVQKSTLPHLAATQEWRGLEKQHATDPHARVGIVFQFCNCIPIPPDLHILGPWTKPECTESCGSLGVLKRNRTCTPKDATGFCTKLETEAILGTPCNRTLCPVTIAVAIGAAFVAVLVAVIVFVVMFKRRRKRSHSEIEIELQQPVPTSPLHEAFPNVPLKSDAPEKSLLEASSSLPFSLTTSENRLLVTIFNDEYGNTDGGDVEKLAAIKEDVHMIQEVLESKYGYEMPSEDPTIFEPGQFENQANLVKTFEVFLKKWKRKQPVGMTIHRFVLYFHGH